MFCRTIAALVFLLIGCAGDAPPPPTEAPPEPTSVSLTFADSPTVYWTAPTMIARNAGLFQKAGVDVTLVSVNSGAEAKNAVVSKAADVGLVADTPIAIGAFANEPTVLIGSYVRVDNVLKVVARGDRGITSLADLRGKKVGIVPATISELALDRWLAVASLTRADVQTVSVKPPDLITVLSRGDVDAIVAWEPFALNAIAAMDPAPVVLDQPPVVVPTLHFVTRPDVVATKREALKRFLQGVLLAERQVQDDPVAARHLVESSLGYPADLLAPVWSDLHIRLHMDVPSTRLELGREAQWALDRKLVQGAVPDFKSTFDTSILRDIASDRVTE